MNYRQKLNLYRRYPHWKKAGCVFIHIPKAAGTSINHSLYGRTLGHYTALEIQQRFPDLYTRCFTFSVVRNPWARTYSAYQFARRGATGSMAIHNPGQYQVAEMATFERFIFEWLAQRELSGLDYVFRPQSGFICDLQGKIMTDYVGRVESLEQCVRKLNSKTAKKISLSHMNRTAADNEYIDAYDTGMIDMVAGLYRQDIELLNYDFQ